MKATGRNLLMFIGLLAVILVGLFWKSIAKPDYAVFSNDSPLGAVISEASSPENSCTTVWQDLNHVGLSGPGSPSSSKGLITILSSPLIILFLVVFAVVVGFGFRTMRIRLMVANGTLMVACLGLLVACLTGWIDPYASQWMLIYPVAFFLLPWLMVGTFIHRDLYDDVCI